LKQAAQLLGVSYRHAKRLAHRFEHDGSAGLVHRHKGQPSNRAMPVEVRALALEFIRRNGYEGLGPTLAAAALASQEGVKVSQETLRRWMLGAGLWAGSRKRQLQVPLTQSTHFGEVVTLRGRLCSWPQERRTVNWIVQLTDEATETMALRVAREPIWALAGVLRAWVDLHGIPRTLRIDWNHMGLRERHLKAWTAEITPVSHFRKICEALGLPLSPANMSRNDGQSLEAHWDRLRLEFSRRTIASDGAANDYLDREYVPDCNRRCTRPAAADGDVHRPVSEAPNLSDVFRIEEERPIADDWTVQYRGRLYEVSRESRFAPARDRVLVREWPDRRMEILYRGRTVKWRLLPGTWNPSTSRRWSAPKSERGDTSIERSQGRF
jgi:transposase